MGDKTLVLVMYAWLGAAVLAGLVVCGGLGYTLATLGFVDPPAMLPVHPQGVAGALLLIAAAGLGLYRLWHQMLQLPR